MTEQRKPKPGGTSAPATACEHGKRSRELCEVCGVDLPPLSEIDRYGRCSKCGVCKTLMLPENCVRQQCPMKVSPVAPPAVTQQAEPEWPANWLRDGWNGCMLSAIAALQFLANNPRPSGGSSNFNSEHLFQIASELATTQERLLGARPHAASQRPSPAPQVAGASDVEKLHAALVIAEAALSDIGDADREPGDDLEWCERRAAQDLPIIRAALTQAKKEAQ